MDKLESLLESYYGMQDEETATRDALDVNSPNFSASEYASQVLQQKSLPELMAYSGQLVQETRGLDRDMQDLVYNNYNKFISATDTIKRMRDSVGEMETNMNRLVTDMRTMGGSSASVNTNLQENRGKIEKLVGVKRLLIKLEFLFELPVRLKRAMELDALAQAVRYYTMVSGVMKKFDRIASIHAIRVDADAIMNKLKEQLRSTLRSSKTVVSAASSARVVEAIRLLVQLDEPRPALRAAFLGFQKSRLLTTLGAYAARYAPPSLDGSGPMATLSSAATSTGDGSSLMSDRARQYFALAQQQKAAMATSTLATTAAARPRAPISAQLFVQGANRSFLEAFRYAADLYVELFEESPSGALGGEAGPDVSELEKRSAHEELLAFTKDIFGEYFAVLRKQLSLPPALPSNSEEDTNTSPERGGGGRHGAPALFGSPSAEAGYEVDEDEAAAARAKADSQAAAAAFADEGDAGAFSSVTDALKCVLTDVRGASKCVREARLPDRATELTEAVLRAQLDGLFADVRGDVTRTLVRLQLEAVERVEGAQRDKEKDWAVASGASLTAAADKASHDISERIDDALGEAKPLVLAGMRLLPDLARTFNGLVHGQVLNLLAWMAAALEACGDGAHAARVEWHGVVVEADLGLDKDREGSGAHGGGAGDDRKRRQGMGSSRQPTAAASASVKRRATVNFAYPEADQSAAVLPPAAVSSPLLSPGERDRAAGFPFLLLAAVLARHFAHNGVARALSTMLQALPTRADMSAHGIADGGDPDADESGEGSYGAMMDVPDLIKRTQGAGRELLRRWAYLHGSRLSTVVRRSLTSTPGGWLTRGEPREVRLVVGVLLTDIAGLRKMCAAALGEWDAAGCAAVAAALGIGARGGAEGEGGGSGGNPFGAPASSSGSRATGHLSVPTPAAAAKRTALVVGAAGTAGAPGGGSSSAAAGVGNALGGGSVTRGLPLDMEHLFMGKAGGAGGGGDGRSGVGSRFVLGAVDFNAESVARVLLRQALKSHVEWSRGLTLSRGGYGQLQADLAALHMALPFFLHARLPPAPTQGHGPGNTGSSSMAWDPYAGGTSLEELVREAAVSAAERAVEPRPVEPSILNEVATACLAGLDLPGALP